MLDALRRVLARRADGGDAAGAAPAAAQRRARDGVRAAQDRRWTTGSRTRDTVIEVKCADRLGLLYLITRTLSAARLDIASARIATEIDQAYDTFYVHDRAGRKLDEPAGHEPDSRTRWSRR